MHYKDTLFVFIGAVFQKLRHIKHTFWHVREREEKIVTV